MFQTSGWRLMIFGFVCTNYNNSSYTRDAVSSLLGGDGGEFRIVVVDNNSDEKNVQILKAVASEFRHVELILNRENVGYFRGLNLGIRRLRSGQPDIAALIVGNNDLLFPPEFAANLRKNLSLFDACAVVSPDIITLEGVHQNPYVAREPGRFGKCLYRVYYANYYLAMAMRQVAKVTRSFRGKRDPAEHESAREIYAGLGACYVLGRPFFQHFEELWAPTFLAREEFFLSKQLSDKGLRIYYEPSIKVLHHWGVAMRPLGNRKTWQLARDSHRIYRRHANLAASPRGEPRES